MNLNQWIVLATICLSLRAGVTNLIAYHKGFSGGFSKFKTLCLTRGTLALVYTTSFVWLFFNPERRLDWSRVMLGVGLVTWDQVWRRPASEIIKAQAEVSRLLAERVALDAAIDAQFATPLEGDPE